MVRSYRQNRRKRHPYVIRRGTDRLKTVHDLTVAQYPSTKRFTHVTIRKTAVAGQKNGSAGERHVMSYRMRNNRHIEKYLDDITVLPLVFKRKIRT